jgi:hypothetical protein
MWRIPKPERKTFTYLKPNRKMVFATMPVHKSKDLLLSSGADAITWPTAPVEDDRSE